MSATATANTESAVVTTTARNQATTAARWSLDAAHSHVSFSVRHMMISNVRGAFTSFGGEASYDPANPEQTKLSVNIDVASIDTREPKRDAHLRSPDFFDAEKNPQITFVSKSTRAKGEGLEVVGDLTIAGTTREVTLAVEDITPESQDPWGGRRMGATASTKIRRSDFGMRWNAALEAGGVLVGDEIKISIEAELVKQAS